MAVSLRASLLATVLATALLPLGALAYLELRDLGAREDETARSELEAQALALALRAESAAQRGEDPLASAAGAAGEATRVLLVERDGAWRSASGARGHAPELAAQIGDALSGVVETTDPEAGGDARAAWARVPSTDASLVLVAPPAEVVSPIDWTFVALLGSLAAGAIALASLLTWLVIAPVRRLERASARFAGGAWDARAPVSGAREVRALATAFNAMADDIGTLQAARAQRLAERRADLEALHFAMAHEVREPLRSVRWMLDDALESGEREPLRLARARVDEVDALLQDLMRYEDVAMRDAPVSDVDLGEVLEEAWEASGGRIRWSREGAPSRVRGSAELLVTALAEVFDNAARHGASRVVARFEARAEHVVLRLDDDGPGIAPSRQEDAFHLFQRFHRGEGTGVGLAILRRAVERHDGRVQLSESPEGGLRVEVQLPRGGPHDAREAEAEAPRRRF